MRPNTLADAVENICAGASHDVVLAEFVDAFDMAKTDQERYASIEREPRLTGDEQLDALVGAIAEYLAKQRRLGRVPSWGFSTASGQSRSSTFSRAASAAQTSG